MTLKDAMTKIEQLEAQIKALKRQLHDERRNGDSIREILATFNPPKKEVKHDQFNLLEAASGGAGFDRQ